MRQKTKRVHSKQLYHSTPGTATRRTGCMFPGHHGTVVHVECWGRGRPLDVCSLDRTVQQLKWALTNSSMMWCVVTQGLSDASIEYSIYRIDTCHRLRILSASASLNHPLIWYMEVKDGRGKGTKGAAIAASSWYGGLRFCFSCMLRRCRFKSVL